MKQVVTNKSGALQVLEDINAVGVEVSQRLLDHRAEPGGIKPAVVVKIWGGYFDDVMELMPSWMVLENIAQRPTRAILIARVDEIYASFQRPLESLFPTS